MIKNILFVFLPSFFMFCGCAKEQSTTSSIPNSFVSIDIQTQLENRFANPYYSKIYTDKGRAGYGGVIAISNSDASSIYAFDMCCPYEAPVLNIVDKLNALQVECPSCRSVYNIADGTGRAVSGPSDQHLKAYRVIRDGYFYRIRN